MKREFSKEFKRDAVSLVVDQGYSRVEAASSLDIHPALLSRWVREHTEEEDGGDAFRGKGKLRPEQEEIRQLREEMKYSFIAQNKKTWPVDVMSRLMGINRNSYYSYQRRQKNRPEDPEHQEKLDWIKKVAEDSQYTYGGRRMRKALNAAKNRGVVCATA